MLLGQIATLLISAPMMGAAAADNYVHPIEIENKHLVDSVTRERFLVKGVDYQPGGSSGYTGYSDPLSDQNICARDITAMQELGVNTMRVYTVNPDLDHDKCMTMLAAANIYLILDVNSPLIGESINRYEPWTTYTPAYLEHVFKVVDQFSQYNNTLGFFIGNEIVNDERSASASPPYIKAVTRDVKNYQRKQGLRRVPIGYSTADDIKFRKSLPAYLTCGPEEETIDFYGVNSYQWCGEQDMNTSGYNTLIEHNKQVPVPIVLSEFGCNLVQPRIFQEVGAIFSPPMTDVFDGGLAYEFTEGSNEFGLVSVEIDHSIRQNQDFVALKSEYEKVSKTAPKSSGPGSSAANGLCKQVYEDLPGASKQIPASFGTEMIRNGVNVRRGKYDMDMVGPNGTMPASCFHIIDVQGRYQMNPRIKIVNQLSDGITVNWKQYYLLDRDSKDGDNKSRKNNEDKSKKSSKNTSKSSENNSTTVDSSSETNGSSEAGRKVIPYSYIFCVLGVAFFQLSL